MKQPTQLQLFAAIAEAFGPGVTVDPRQATVIIEACNKILAAMALKAIPATPGMGLSAWLSGGDTGMSSKFMASILASDWVPTREYAYPHDAADFGRCVRLLEAAPELRANLKLMIGTGKEWAELVRCWEGMEAYYRAGDNKYLGDLVGTCVR